MTRADVVEHAVRAQIIPPHGVDMVRVGRALAEHEELTLPKILEIDASFGLPPILSGIPFAKCIVNLLTCGEPKLLVQRFLEDGIDVDPDVLVENLRELFDGAPSAEVLAWAHRTMVVWQWIGEAKTA